MSTQKVVEFVSTTNFPDLPQKVVARARITIKDHLGVMLAAHRDAAGLAAADMAHYIQSHPAELHAGIPDPGHLDAGLRYFN